MAAAAATADDIESLLTRVYTDPLTSPVAYGSPMTVWKYLQKHYFPQYKISLNRVKNFLAQFHEQQAFQKPTRLNAPGVPVVAYGQDDLWQLDLVDTHDKHFVLSKIDVASRVGDLVYIHNKSGLSVTVGVQRLFDRNENVPPKRIQTDEGKEFYNKHVLKLLKEYDVDLFSSQGDNKAAVVERFNRTWQTMYYKYLSALGKQSVRQKQKLLDLVVKNYNQKPHTALGGDAPGDLTYDNVSELVSDKVDALIERWRQRRHQPLKSSIKVGDYVRIMQVRKQFHKAYRGNFVREVFQVRAATRSPLAPDLVLYKLRDLDGEDVKGNFSRHHLIKTFLPTKPWVEKI